MESAYVEFKFAIPRGSSIGIYGRKNAIPTLTMNDVNDVLSGFRDRQTRAASNAVSYQKCDNLRGKCIAHPKDVIENYGNLKLFPHWSLKQQNFHNIKIFSLPWQEQWATTSIPATGSSLSTTTMAPRKRSPLSAGSPPSWPATAPKAALATENACWDSVNASLDLMDLTVDRVS